MAASSSFGSAQMQLENVECLKSLLEGARARKVPSKILDTLGALRALGSLRTSVLAESKIGVLVNGIAKDSAVPDAVRAKAKDLVEEWRQAVRQQKVESEQAPSEAQPNVRSASSLASTPQASAPAALELMRPSEGGPATQRRPNLLGKDFAERRVTQAQTPTLVDVRAAKRFASAKVVAQRASSTPGPVPPVRDAPASDNATAPGVATKQSASNAPAPSGQQAHGVPPTLPAPPEEPARPLPPAASDLVVQVSGEYVRGARLFTAWVPSLESGKRLMAPGRKSAERADADGKILLELAKISPRGDGVAAKWRGGDCTDGEVARMVKELTKVCKRPAAQDNRECSGSGAAASGKKSMGRGVQLLKKPAAAKSRRKM